MQLARHLKPVSVNDCTRCLNAFLAWGAQESHAHICCALPAPRGECVLPPTVLGTLFNRDDDGREGRELQDVQQGIVSAA